MINFRSFCFCFRTFSFAFILSPYFQNTHIKIIIIIYTRRHGQSPRRRIVCYLGTTHTYFFTAELKNRLSWVWPDVCTRSSIRKIQTKLPLYFLTIFFLNWYWQYRYARYINRIVHNCLYNSTFQTENIFFVYILYYDIFSFQKYVVKYISV